MFNNSTMGHRSLAVPLAALRPQPLDALGLTTLLSSLYFFQVWGLTLAGSILPPMLHATLMALSLLGALLPRLGVILVVNATAFASVYVLSSPIASNNQATAFFFSLVVIGAAVATRSTADRDVLFDRIASSGRWILPAMYFFGIYHKINADFLDPAVSCAVVLYDALLQGGSLARWPLGHYGAIYATFVIEAIAMIALFIPRLKVYGMLIGIPFHVIIGFTGYAYYKDFSTIVLVLYALFIPKEAYVTAFRSASTWIGSQEGALRTGRRALLGLAALYFAASFLLGPSASLLPTHEAFVPVFAVYTLGFFLFAILCTPRDGGSPHPRRAGWLLIIPLLYFANGWSPYLGLKTESSIAMYSNLHTEGGQTNHLFHGVVPGLWQYQDDLVWPVASNSRSFNASFVGEGRALVRYELDRMLAAEPRLVVTLDTPEGQITTDETWPNTYLSASALARKILIFKPVDFTRPKQCTH